MTELTFAATPTGHRFIDLTGQHFGAFTVLGFKGREKLHSKWWCLCICGTIRAVNSNSLRTNHTRSCGCLFRGAIGDRTRTHGMRNTAEYRAWRNMWNRCTNPKVEKYPLYGGRGIRVCERWQKFENFIADMGTKPSSQHTLDRKDCNSGYEQTNCRWATWREQRMNQRRMQKETPVYKGVRINGE